MKERWIYLIMFFAFCLFANQQTLSKKEMQKDTSGQLVNVQPPNKGIISENVSFLKKPDFKRIETAFQDQELKVENRCTLCPVNTDYFSASFLFKPPSRLIRRFLFFPDNSDDEFHLVA